MKIAHIINPFISEPDRDCYTAQPIVFETMRRAKGFAKGQVKVDLLATVYPEDEKAIPLEFRRVGDLNQSILDIAHFDSKQRKLPLFQDILDRAYEASEGADYLIQTNIDIGLMPHFYMTVKRLLEMGWDALIINKRIISRHYKSVEEIPEMYCDLGTDHNGCDCFVFRRDLFPLFDLGNICMGTPWSETTLVANMVKYSKAVKFIRRPHLTFHIGDNRTWIPLSDYRQYNTEEFGRILTELSEDMPELSKHHILEYFIHKMKLEIKPDYSKECHDLCDNTALLF